MEIIDVCVFKDCYTFLEWNQVREWYTPDYCLFDTYFSRNAQKEKMHMVC